jgi:thioester reductase-like protein
VCLVHWSPVCVPNVTSVPGDVTEPMFGLAERACLELAARVDAVIHCAAVTDFDRTDGSLEATNIAGTGHVAAFAAAAGAVLYHVSTAFVHATADGDRGRTATGYASSKSAAEQVVRSSGVPHVILRPSVVIGDSVTGEIAAFQGIAQIAAGMFAGIMPMVPFDPGWPLDFVPADVVADAVMTHCPHLVTEVRGEGLLIGVDFVSADIATEFLIGLLDEHVIPSYSLNCSNVLRLTPPAILGVADLDWLGRALTSAAKHVSRIMPATAA